MDVRRTKYDNMYFVTSETGNGEYQLFFKDDRWVCNCGAYVKGKNKGTPCKHIACLLEYLKETEGGREPEEDPTMARGGMETPPPYARNGTSSSTASPISKWVKQIHGKEFIEYQGLLAMAHEQGLQELSVGFISVDATIALAVAYAFFKDGRKFSEAADATPENVNKAVKAHFPRVALTRAKARVLRDALNIGMVAVEELED